MEQEHTHQLPMDGDATTTTTTKQTSSIQLTPEEGAHAISSLQQLIRYETVSAKGPSTGAYKECATYLLKQLESIGCLEEVHFLEESPDHSPVVMACWKGLDPSLDVILLNSHYDVVPVMEKEWTVPAFDGLIRDGNIYGRGTQDMKSVCIQYIEAIRKLATSSFQQQQQQQPTRTIWLSFVPDEEIGGHGMATLLGSKLYKTKLENKIALALDEGLASTTPIYSVFYGERLPWWISITATGNTGHGSRFIEQTAVEQLLAVTTKAMEFRRSQRTLLHQGTSHYEQNCSHAVVAKKKKTLGDVTTLNITALQAGVQVANTYAYNVVPPIAKCALDIRISPHVPPSQIRDMLDTWCQECSSSNNNNNNKLSWEYIGNIGNKDTMQEHPTTSTNVQINPWYGVFLKAVQNENMQIQVDPQVFPAATDSRFLRALGIRALGFSPMRCCPILLHENDEYIPISTFLEGIQVYVGLIKELSSQGKEM